MSIFYFAGIPFDLPDGVQITETTLSENFRNYYSVNPGGINISFSMTKIGDNFWTYSGDINLSITKIGDAFVIFTGDVSGSVARLGTIFSGMEDERRDFLFEVFDSQVTTVNPGITSGDASGNPNEDAFEWQGTAGDDQVNTFDLYQQKSLLQ